MISDFSEIASKKMPLTLSNLLASGENGQKIIESISFSISLDCLIYEWLNPTHIFWNMGQYLEDGFVYLMQAEDTDFFKIGKSISPTRRLKQIYPKMPFETKLIGFRRTNYMSLCEKLQHSKYESHRANGEWFRLQGEVRKAAIDFFLSDQESRLEDFVGGGLRIDTPDSTWEWQENYFEISNRSFYELAIEIALLWQFSSNGKSRAQGQIAAFGGQL